MSEQGGTIKAFHFLRSDMAAGHGTEPPWTVGETRTWEGPIKLCESGYHSAPSRYDALQYAPGPVACVVDVSEPVERDDTKYVSRTRTLVAAHNVERELRLFACDCAERALQREREMGLGPDKRSWEAIAVSRRYANGEATDEELAVARVAAREAAREAAWEAAGNAAWDAAWEAAGAAAWEAAGAAAWEAAGAAARVAARATEIEWQRAHLDELLNPLFAEVQR
jgi:hypothetical protein